VRSIRSQSAADITMRGAALLQEPRAADMIAMRRG
jgi:hypothetical protein